MLWKGGKLLVAAKPSENGSMLEVGGSRHATAGSLAGGEVPDHPVAAASATRRSSGAHHIPRGKRSDSRTMTVRVSGET